jgi:Leucine-rich repeat (LRR) protein
MKYILSTLFVISLFFQFIENVPLNQSLLFTTYGYNKNSTSINLFARSINEIDVDTFAGLDKLEVLYLHDNKIAKIDSLLFKGLSNLRELWLESNNIVTIDKNAFGNLTNLELVCLNDNPLSSNFPGIVSSLCSNSPRCVLKVTEKCLNSTIYECNFKFQAILFYIF